MGERQVLLQDPYHAYGQYMIELLERRYGIRSVCFYTEPLTHRLEARKFPALSSAGVVASYLVKPTQLDDFARMLAQRHQIAAVMPLNEPAVTPAVQLAAALGLSWAQPEIMARFRDKYALKQSLADVPDGPRVNAFRSVSSMGDVAEFIATNHPRRIVIKPRDGFGNQGVGIFDADSPDEIAAMLRAADGRSLLIEEFLEGEEYFVNGQVDGAGRIAIIAIFNNSRVSINGREGVHIEYRKVDHQDPRFAVLSDYVSRVVAATGLRRNPFHAELIIDSQGPCLVEIAARLCGTNNVFEMNQLHGGAFDAFDLAAHYYLSSTDYGPFGLDWARYDFGAYRQVLGLSEKSGCIHELSGVAEVEAGPHFRGWVQRPRFSQHVSPTVDLFSTPWKLELAGGTSPDLGAAAAEARELIRWNDQSHGLRRLGRAARAYAALLWRYRFACYPKSPVGAVRRPWRVRPRGRGSVTESQSEKSE